jgi:hypothetical protein
MASRDNELAELADIEFRSIELKVIHDLNEDSNKQVSGVRKSLKAYTRKLATRMGNSVR